MADPKDEALTRTVLTRPGAPGASADDDRAHYLVCVEGAARGRRIEFFGKDMIIGRAEPADIVIVGDERISRRHCRVGLVMGELFVTDLGSSNGTFIGTRKLTAPALLAPGERITVGDHVLEHEWRSKREVQAAHALDSTVDKAGQYVRSLLPARIESGPVRTDWVLQPSARLGGDMFGYHFIDDHTFAIYLIDVTGHGADAAMHAVSVMNVLRQKAIPGIDVRDPAQMASHLNGMFPMERHGGMLLSLWYGVIDVPTRQIAFTSAGHHPSFVVSADRRGMEALDVANVLIGMMPGYSYRGATSTVPPGASLHIFSDGVFEIERTDGEEFGLDAFLSLLTLPADPARPESERILETVKQRTGRQSFEDDFTLVVATFG